MTVITDMGHTLAYYLEMLMCIMYLSAEDEFGYWDRSSVLFR